MVNKKIFHEYAREDFLFEFGLYQQIKLDLLSTVVTTDTIMTSEKPDTGDYSEINTLTIKKSNDFINLINFMFSADKIRWQCPLCEDKSVFKYEIRHPNKSLINKKKEGKITLLDLREAFIYNDKEIVLDVDEYKDTATHMLQNQLNALFIETVSEFRDSAHERIFFEITIICEHESSHKYNFHFLLERERDENYNYYLTKIGQYPSLADFQSFTTKEYYTILNTLRLYKEYSCALGLFAHGIGIGSFVYLRRILETLVYNTFEKVCNEGKVTDDEFNFLEYTDEDKKPRKRNRRFVEKITLLKDYLPKMLVNNTSLYGILSQGVHCLSESDCKACFPVIKQIIDCILLDIYKTQEEEKLTVAISKMEQQINQK